MSVSRWVHSVNMPPHRWYKSKSFRTVSFEWRPPGGEESGIAISLAVNLGQLRSSLPVAMGRDCYALFLNVSSWPSPLVMRSHRFRVWLNDAETMSCRATWFAEMNGERKDQSQAVPGLTYGVLHHQTKQTGVRGMPNEVYIDWLRESFPQLDTFLETALSLERGLAEARSRTRSALSS